MKRDFPLWQTADADNESNCRLILQRHCIALVRRPRPPRPFPCLGGWLLG